MNNHGRVISAHAPRRCAGFSACDLLVMMTALILLSAVTLPLLASTTDGMGIAGSKRNLMQLHMAHQMYGADHNGNQWVNAPHDLAEFGSTYNDAMGNWIQSLGAVHPYVSSGNWLTFVGWAIEPASGTAGLWQFQTNLFTNPLMMDDTAGSTATGSGYYRLMQTRGFNPYVNGTFYDKTFFAPRHTVALAAVDDCFEHPTEYCVPPPGGSHMPFYSTYSLSPAALYHPDLWNVPEGEFPESTDAIFAQLDNAFAALPYTSAKYPDLKTHISEHVWLQNNTIGPCNDGGPAGMASYDGCHSYLFNASIFSSPVTLFYDGHVRLLPMTEVKAADEQIGVWRRDTPMGEQGYFQDFGVPGDENPNLSHHILTNGGILGRDTLGQ